jgi:hypothetical protein
MDDYFSQNGLKNDGKIKRRRRKTNTMFGLIPKVVSRFEN